MPFTGSRRGRGFAASIGRAAGDAWRPRLVGVLALAMTCLFSPPAVAAPAWHSGASVGGVRVVRLRLSQLGASLMLDVQFRQGAKPDLLAARAGGALCLFVTGSTGERHSACVARGPDVWRVTLDGARHNSALVRWADSWLRLRLPLGLPPGVATWTARLYAGHCPGACVLRLPARGHWRIRLTPLPTETCGLVAPAPGTGPEAALTFDDGPSPYTPALLNELDALRVPATFFLVGRQVAGSQPLLRRMLRDGEVLGNHTWDHVDVSRGGAQAAIELERTSAAIAAATGGYRPCLFRPPYGSTSPALEALARRLGMQTVLWTVDPRDWSRPGTGTIVARVLAAVRPHAIILLHDGGGPRRQTVAAVPAIVTSLRARGYRFVTLPTLLAAA